jgi:hypothetical protein
VAIVHAAKPRCGLALLGKTPRTLTALFLAAPGPASPAAALTFDVTVGTWADSSTLNSFAWAIDQVNAIPGADLIRLHTDVDVDAAVPIPFPGGFLAGSTDVAGLNI